MNFCSYPLLPSINIKTHHAKGNSTRSTYPWRTCLRFAIPTLIVPYSYVEKFRWIFSSYIIHRSFMCLILQRRPRIVNDVSFSKNCLVSISHNVLKVQKYISKKAIDKTFEFAASHRTVISRKKCENYIGGFCCGIFIRMETWLIQFIFYFNDFFSVWYHAFYHKLFWQFFFKFHTRVSIWYTCFLLSHIILIRILINAFYVGNLVSNLAP